MKLVAISDVHMKWGSLKIPECDILISAGDYSFRGEPHAVKAFHEWLHEQPAKHIISVQGNHELWVEKNFEEAKALAKSVCPRVHFIQHEAIEIEGIKIFGSAWTPWFYDWAWNADRNEIGKYWADIPMDTDILITHGPPKYILDEVYSVCGSVVKDRVGCGDLSDKVFQLPNLKHHIFGHIHGAHGHKNILGKKFWNAAICDEMYGASNPITEIDY